MCGYIFYAGNKVKKNKVKDLLNLQKHRGPDFSKAIEEKNLLFLHNRLKIIDLSNKANQPFKDKLGNIIIFNGEIYNYKKLKDDFNLQNLKTESDTEVILALYRKIGKDFVKYLNGIFSFVIYIKKDNKIFVARDRFGVKPLFYYKNKKKLIFSTEIKPILSLIKKKKFNYRNILRYLITGKYFDTNKTFFQNINIFPQAHSEIIDLKNNQVLYRKRYWSLKVKKKLMCNNFNEFYIKFLDKAKRSLKLNLVSNVKVAAMLSSGKDSNFIYKILKENLYPNITTFTYGWKHKNYDEIKRLNDLKHDLKNNFKMRFSIKDFLKNFEKIIYRFEGPIGGFGTLAQFKLLNFVKRKKIKVALSGEGADEFLLGYKNFEQYLKKDSQFDKDLIFSPDGKPLNDEKLFNDFRLEPILKKATKFKNLNELVNYYAFNVKLPKLLNFLDKAGSLNGVEGRVPFLDHELVEFIYSNNPKFRLNKKPIDKYFESKHDRYFKKKFFVNTPQREYFKSVKVKKKIFKMIHNGILVKKNILKFDEFKKKYNSYLKEKKPSNSFFIWKVFEVELFFKAYIKSYNIS